MIAVSPGRATYLFGSRCMEPWTESARVTARLRLDTAGARLGFVGVSECRTVAWGPCDSDLTPGGEHYPPAWRRPRSLLPSFKGNVLYVSSIYPVGGRKRVDKQISNLRKAPVRPHCVVALPLGPVRSLKSLAVTLNSPNKRRDSALQGWGVEALGRGAPLELDPIGPLYEALPLKQDHAGPLLVSWVLLLASLHIVPLVLESDTAPAAYCEQAGC